MTESNPKQILFIEYVSVCVSVYRALYEILDEFYLSVLVNNKMSINKKNMVSRYSSVVAVNVLVWECCDASNYYKDTK